MVHPALYRCVWLLYLYRPVYYVYVLRGGSDSYVPADWCMGFGSQGVLGHEADPDADGRLGPVDPWIAGYLLL